MVTQEGRISESEMMQLVSMMSPAQANILVLGDMVDVFLKSFERRFDTDEASLSIEEMQHYILSANYMAARYNRKNIVGRVSNELKERQMPL